jgi:hypothetical protein
MPPFLEDDVLSLGDISEESIMKTQGNDDVANSKRLSTLKALLLFTTRVLISGR